MNENNCAALIVSTWLAVDNHIFIYHPLRLRRDLIWGEMEEGDSQVLVCALATLDRWIALGEQ